MQHNAYFTDSFGFPNVTIEFIYTKLDGNRWAVKASIARPQGGMAFYAAEDEHPDSLEVLIATHRGAVADLVASWATAVRPKVNFRD